MVYLVLGPYARVLDRLVECLRERFNLVSVVVFGSVARGDFRSDSDVDVLIVADNLPDRYERFKIFDDVEKCLEDDLNELRRAGFSAFINPIIKSVEEASRVSPLYLDMVEDAVILYDRNGFFGKVLDRLRGRLRELGAKRVRLGKKWYWILKENYRFGEVIEIE
ncbi:MAG: nucleotidyltransferase domain-containing protein [Candidatus Jordarchaeales archaeon]